MLHFREFLDNLDSQRQPMSAPPATPPPQKPAAEPKEKGVKLGKDQVLQHWGATPPNAPIKMTPLPYNYKGPTYDKDGVRITGSGEFVDSILGRLKDLMFYENPKVKLNLIYRTLYKKGQIGNPAYAVYIQSEMRGNKRKANIFKK